MSPFTCQFHQIPDQSPWMSFLRSCVFFHVAAFLLAFSLFRTTAGVAEQHFLKSSRVAELFALRRHLLDTAENVNDQA
jgi:hypothetical protein